LEGDHRAEAGNLILTQRLKYATVRGFRISDNEKLAAWLSLGMENNGLTRLSTKVSNKCYILEGAMNFKH
jgi:hypothetical protein